MSVAGASCRAKRSWTLWRQTWPEGQVPGSLSLCISCPAELHIHKSKWNSVESSPSISPWSSSSPCLIFSTISPGYFSSLTQKSLLLIGTNEDMVPVFLVLSYPPYIVCKESCWSSAQDRSPFHRCGTALFWTE